MAALSYRHRQHVINLFCWPDTHGAVSVPAWDTRGYTVRRWSQDGLELWCVSDLSAPELAEFERLLRR